MLLKVLFVSLVLAFGGAMFMAGLTAPPSLRTPLATAAQRAVTPLHGPYLRIKERMCGAVEPEVAGQPRTHHAERYADLMLTSEVTSDAAYGVQVGIYAQASEALHMARRLGEAGSSTRLVELGENGDVDAYVLAVGPFSSLIQSQIAQRRLLLAVPNLTSLVPIVLPKEEANVGASSAAPSTPTLHPPGLAALPHGLLADPPKGSLESSAPKVEP